MKLKEEYKIVESESSTPANVTGAAVSTDVPKITPKRFAGMDVFEVCPEVFHRCIKGKRKYLRYDTYVGDDDVGVAIRDYGRNNPKKPIVLQNSRSGSMIYLKR